MDNTSPGHAAKRKYATTAIFELICLSTGRLASRCSEPSTEGTGVLQDQCKVANDNFGRLYSLPNLKSANE